MTGNDITQAVEPLDLPEGWTVEPYHPDHQAPEGHPDQDCTGGESGGIGV